MTTKHSPAPWRAQHDFAGGFQVVDANGHDMIHRGRTTALMREENARLIAAAPDMLAALKELAFRAARHGMNADEANVAIAKAEGRS
jgi:hypothetical protein